MKKFYYLTLFFALFFSACSTTHVVQDSFSSKISKAIFLEPVSNNDKIIYISSRNSSDCNVDISNWLKDNLSQKGYSFTTDATKANFVLTANITKCSRLTDQEIKVADLEALSGNLGGLGALMTLNQANSSTSYIDRITGIYYTIRTVIDINIRQKNAGRVTVNNSENMTKTQNYQSDYINNNTTLTLSVRGKNITFEDVKDKLEKNISLKISEFFF